MSTSKIETNWAIYNELSNIHVSPIDDLKEHVLAKDCWCNPFDEDGVVVHNSMDARELYERGSCVNLYLNKGEIK